jgi:hypothetical protein
MDKQALLRQYKEQAESKGSSFDWETRTWSMKVYGKQRVRILPNVDGGLDFYEDGVAKLSDRVYQDVNLSEKNNPVRMTLNALWDEEDSIRKNLYRSMKIQRRVRYQIVLLNDDGTVADKTPKLYDAPKSLHNKLVEYQLANDVDVTDYEDGQDLWIVKEEGERYADYSKSHFDKPSTFNPKDIDQPGKLTDGRYYKIGKKTMDILSKINKQFDLGLSLFNNSAVPAQAAVAPKPTTVADDELDEWEKVLYAQVKD